MAGAAADPNQRLRYWHAASACLIAVFVLLHIGNHVAMFWGQDTHRAVMQPVRTIYRNPVLEVALLAAFAFQLTSGLVMLRRRMRSGPEGWVGKVQLASGAVLLGFVVIHVAAVLSGRLVLGLDTDFRFAAAGFHAGLAWFFIPYYFAGVLALFVHIGCALYWRMSAGKGRYALAMMALLGGILGAGFVGAMASDDAIPAAYLETYR